MRVAAFTRYGRTAASTRQRLLQYLPALADAGIKVDVQSLLGDDYVRSLAGRGGFSRLDVVRAYADRARLLATSEADLIWIYVEAFPYLPGLLERIAFRSGTPVVVDFDDAFFHRYDSHPNPLVRAALRGKIETLLKRAAACVCGNEYLLRYAERFCDRSIIIPTVVDIDRYRPAPQSPPGPTVIGWIGSPSTWCFLEPVLPLLAELAARPNVVVRVVGAGEAAEARRFSGLDLVDWSEAGEIAAVQSMDIGIMPLPDADWARGKSGYKLIQYMACGLPVVASPVGVNSEIVVEGETGVLAHDAAGWRAALDRLIGDRELRMRFGAAGRERAVQLYSLQAHAPRLIDLFTSVAQAQRGNR